MWACSQQIMWHGGGFITCSLAWPVCASSWEGGARLSPCTLSCCVRPFIVLSKVSFSPAALHLRQPVPAVLLVWQRSWQAWHQLWHLDCHSRLAPGYMSGFVAQVQEQQGPVVPSIHCASVIEYVDFHWIFCLLPCFSPQPPGLDAARRQVAKCGSYFTMCRRELESEPEGACPSKMMIPDVDSSASCLNGRACLVPSGW